MIIPGTRWGQMGRGSRGGPLTYATLNPADKGSNISLSGGDLVFSSSSGTWNSVRGTQGKAAGKWYFYVRLTSFPGGSNIICGVGTTSASTGNYPGSNSSGWGVQDNGALTNGGIVGSAGISWAANDYVQIALDVAAGKLWFGKNGTWVGDPAAGTGSSFTGVSGTLFPLVGSATGSSAAGGTCNFGATAFVHGAPSGFNPGWYI